MSLLIGFNITRFAPNKNEEKGGSVRVVEERGRKRDCKRVCERVGYIRPCIRDSALEIVC